MSRISKYLANILNNWKWSNKPWLDCSKGISRLNCYTAADSTQKQQFHLQNASQICHSRMLPFLWNYNQGSVSSVSLLLKTSPPDGYPQTQRLWGIMDAFLSSVRTSEHNYVYSSPVIGWISLQHISASALRITQFILIPSAPQYIKGMGGFYKQGEDTEEQWCQLSMLSLHSKYWLGL